MSEDISGCPAETGPKLESALDWIRGGAASLQEVKSASVPRSGSFFSFSHEQNRTDREGNLRQSFSTQVMKPLKVSDVSRCGRRIPRA